MMQWNSLSEFLHMGGYGLYVWGSFATGAGALLLEQVLLRRRRAAILGSLRNRARAQRLERRSS